MTSIKSVLLGAFLGALISFVSFQYKERKSGKEKLNRSLFNLLSAWSSVSVNAFLYSDEFKNSILEGLKRKFPNDVFPPNFDEELIRQMRFLFPVADQHDLYDKYHTSIENLAITDPLLAFQLSSNRILIDYLKVLHKVPEESGDASAFYESFTDFAYQQSMSEFEKDMLQLPALVSRKSLKEVANRINRKKDKFKEIPSTDIDDYLNQVFDPAINKIRSKKNIA